MTDVGDAAAVDTALLEALDDGAAAAATTAAASATAGQMPDEDVAMVDEADAEGDGVSGEDRAKGDAKGGKTGSEGDAKGQERKGTPKHSSKLRMVQLV